MKQVSDNNDDDNADVDFIMLNRTRVASLFTKDRKELPS